MPHTASVQQLQRGYRKVLDYVIEQRQPVVILNNNQPEAVILGVEMYQKLLGEKKRSDMKKALEILKRYRSGKFDVQDTDDLDMQSLVDAISELIIKKFRGKKLSSLEEQLKDI